MVRRALAWAIIGVTIAGIIGSVAALLIYATAETALILTIISAMFAVVWAIGEVTK